MSTPAIFTGTLPAYAGNEFTATAAGFTFVARIESDEDNPAPWQNEDGHGPVSEWRSSGGVGHYARPCKAPGERVLHSDGIKALFYDFAEACAIARRDGWGPAFHSTDIERGANALVRVRARYFRGRDLETYTSDWCDDVNDAHAQVREQLRASFPSARAYAAAAVESDFTRLREWCAGEWQYVGVVVRVYRAGVELAEESTWGVESDAGEYLAEIANELAEQALEPARERAQELAAELAAAVDED